MEKLYSIYQHIKDIINYYITPIVKQREKDSIEALKGRIYTTYNYRKDRKKTQIEKKWLFDKLGDIDINNYDPNIIGDRIDELVDEWISIWNLKLEIGQSYV